MPDHRDALRNIRTFPQLIQFLRDELDWPIASESFEDLTFGYTPEELGIDAASAAKIQEIKRLRPLSANQPWGIFFVKFEPKRLPVVALRRILGRVALKKRASSNTAERAAWAANDLLFVSNYGEGNARQISFAHFSQDESKDDLATLRVLGWDNLDTPLHLDHVAALLTERLIWPDNEKDAAGWRKSWSSAFTLRHREVITTSRALAVRLAELARAIRDRIGTVLAIETENGRITKLMKAFQEALIHDLDAGGFADMYAQTIAYGLLSARVTNPKANTADGFAAQLPVTNPFLRELMEAFLLVGGRKGKAGGGNRGIDFDELGVSEVVELLDDANMAAVVRDFGDRNPLEDPVIHFYELFLKEYDAKKRIQRGVFYTPRPVVSYIVRSVHKLLQTEFGLIDGLADTATWGEIAKRRKDLKAPEGVKPTDRFVTILDPATGTGTFLVEVIDLVHRTLIEKWTNKGHGEKEILDLWNDYVKKHLLSRLHGYELLMAPYAIAHLKVGLKLHETGYRFESDERAQIYLTNALEPAHDFSGTLAFAIPALAHEAEAVNRIKRDARFTVVLGNPPYSRSSGNRGVYADGLIEPYKAPVRAERNIQPLSDDYIKFVALAQHIVSETGGGVIGMITNNTFLSGRIHRGMRKSLLDGAPVLQAINLHGSGKVDVLGSKGKDDENVFDIMQGVSIMLLATRDEHSAISYGELIGPRQAKYDALLGQTPVARCVLEPEAPYYLLVPRSEIVEIAYQGFPSLTDLFGFYSVSGKPGDDALLVSFDKEKVIPQLRETRRAIAKNKSMKLTEAGRNLAARAPHRPFTEESVITYEYRPFDVRYTYYDSAIWTRAVTRLYSCVNGAPVLLATKIVKDPAFSHVFVSRLFADVILLSNTSSVNCYSFPTRGPLDSLTFEQADGYPAGRNLKTSVIAQHLGSTITEDEALGYIYAVLHSPEYRRRYREALQLDFPRIPVTSDRSLFDILSRHGSRLITLHLLEVSVAKGEAPVFYGSADPKVEKVYFDGSTVWIDKDHISGFEGIREDVWAFRVGGYQVCEKWLKDRKGRNLSKSDIEHYQRIIVALSETVPLMKGIDEAIDRYGGWPGAFVPSSKSIEGEVLRAAEAPAKYE